MMEKGKGETANWFSNENSINEKLSKAIGAFGAQLGSSRMGTLTQVSIHALRQRFELQTA
jgi:hypothetical protein